MFVSMTLPLKQGGKKANLLEKGYDLLFEITSNRDKVSREGWTSDFGWTSALPAQVLYVGHYFVICLTTVANCFWRHFNNAEGVPSLDLEIKLAFQWRRNITPPNGEIWLLTSPAISWRMSPANSITLFVIHTIRHVVADLGTWKSWTHHHGLDLNSFTLSPWT